MTVTGRLTAADMRRLEQACAVALVSSPPPLEIDLRQATHIDSTAAALLQYFSQRGVILKRALPSS